MQLSGLEACEDVPVCVCVRAPVRVRISAPLTIVADGCFSNLREGLVDSSSGSVMSKFYAYVVRFAD